ncbi:hypothetical protein DPMN_082850 [Dreissena polymorpha]|uniref:Uncharacterized protein n=1 Tax=Dreissena polymorpha TaxID=45954 RepID=A0A9D4BAI8_DREPO|nr:hypothetical protein DPMN_082850 [Dreissena polymorpha]
MGYSISCRLLISPVENLFKWLNGSTKMHNQYLRTNVWHESGCLHEKPYGQLEVLDTLCSVLHPDDKESGDRE